MRQPQSGRISDNVAVVSVFTENIKGIFVSDLVKVDCVKIDSDIVGVRICPVAVFRRNPCTTACAYIAAIAVAIVAVGLFLDGEEQSLAFEEAAFLHDDWQVLEAAVSLDDQLPIILRLCLKDLKSLLGRCLADNLLLLFAQVSEFLNALAALGLAVESSRPVIGLDLAAFSVEVCDEAIAVIATVAFSLAENDVLGVGGEDV